MSREPWGKQKSFILALVLGGIDICLGFLSESLLGVAAFAAFLFGVVLVVLQVMQEPRPFRWIAWCCLEASLVGIAFANMAVLLLHNME